jgi:hypothetical protein
VRATVRSGGQVVLVTAGAPPEITRGHAGDIGRLHLQHALLSPLAQNIQPRHRPASPPAAT